MISSTDPYVGREATQIKHRVLRLYARRLAYKVGTWCETLNYVEGFAGPWNAHMEDLSDTSPHIAIAELRAAQNHLREIGRAAPRLRCLFVEADPRAAEALRESLESYSNVELHVLHGKFLEKIPAIVEFVRSPTAVPRRFTFIFVDPTGWTGYDPEVIAPLLKTRNTEVLVTFMTKDIIRFIDHSDAKIRRSFDPLFGSCEARRAWEGLRGRDREDAIVDAFCSRLREIGEFRHVVSAIVLHPTKDRTHYHLVYASSHDEGLRTFRDVERGAKAMQRTKREEARTRARVKKTGQEELFGAGEVESRSYLDQLVEECQEAAQQDILSLLRTRKALLYDDLEMVALRHPMTAAGDLKRWLNEWKDSGTLSYEGLEPGKRAPKHGMGHRVVWQGDLVPRGRD